jgi:hypothetical protein
MAVRNYRADQVALIINGRAMKGLAVGTFVTVARGEDSFTMQRSADGSVTTRSATHDKSGTIEFTLLQSTDDHTFLQSLVNDDELNGSGVVAVKVADSSGTFVAQAAEAWLMKPADHEFGRDATERTWTATCDQLEMSGGGNALAS